MTAFGEYADDGTASTMKMRDYKDATDLVAQPLAFKVRGGCEGGGKGFLGSDDAAFTVATTQDQWLAQPIAFPWQLGGTMQMPIDKNLSGSLIKNQTMAVAFGGDIARSLTARHDSSPCADRGMDVVAVAQPVAFAQNQLGEVRTGDVLNTLNTNSNASGRNTPMVAQPIGLDEEQNARIDGFGTLKARMEGGGFEGSVMTTAMQVRRLTAEECEKLQGFLPGYTNIPWRGKPESPDGPRYKALGNSMAVPCMRWIGERINQVEAI